jgi:protease-4
MQKQSSSTQQQQQASTMIDYVQSSVTNLYHTVRSSVWTATEPKQQQEQEQQQQQEPLTPLQATVQFFRNHPKLTQSIVYPLALYGAKKLLQLYNKQYKFNTVLELDLSTITLCEKPVPPIHKLFNPKLVWYYDIIQAIDYAREDDKIVGLVVKIGGGVDSGLNELGFGHIDELRNSLVAFTKTNKLTVCYSDVIGDASNATRSTRQYYLASAFSEIYVVPSGLIVVPGLLLPSIFLKNALEKLEIEPQLLSREEYKTAVNMFTQDKFTEPHREQYETLLNDMSQKISTDIALSRKVSTPKVQEWFNQGIWTPQDASAHGLIDGVAFRDEVYDKINDKLKKNNKNPNYLFLTSYLEKKGHKYQKGNKEVALIFAEGGIQRGEEEPSFFDDQEATIYADTLARHIRLAANDKNVKAIILRVNSPGGDAIASDIINREIVLAKQKGKKIIISMASVAASGGYWISMNADSIVCNPLAITGSIGVIFGKLVVKDLLENKLGVTFDEVHSHERSTIASSLHRYNDDQLNVTNKLIDFYYDAFKQNVATGRKIHVDTVAQIAKGQVYLGERAITHKLVDRIGGLNEAIAVAKETIFFDEEKDQLQLTIYPRAKSLTQKILSSKKAQNSEQRDKQVQMFSFVPVSNSFTKMFGIIPAFTFAFKSLFGVMMNGGTVQSTLNMNILGSSKNNSNNTNNNIQLKDPLAQMWMYN